MHAVPILEQTVGKMGTDETSSASDDIGLAHTLLSLLQGSDLVTLEAAAYPHHEQEQTA
jgi:hypothetical protein